MSLRPAAVAGTWYPGIAGALAREVDGYLDAADAGPAGNTVAIISPHAGIMFSGPVAAHAYKTAATGAYDVAVLVGPSHFAAFDGVGGSLGRSTYGDVFDLLAGVAALGFAAGVQRGGLNRTREKPHGRATSAIGSPTPPPGD